ncbi:MAG: hypothetical protein V3U18_03470 [Alphaproteobacteria bacterium]
MPYVSRDKDGKIIAIFGLPTEDATEELVADDAQVLKFLSGAEPSQESLKWELLLSDMAMGRLTEDLIDVLMEKNVIALTDLPEAAQKKLLRRQNLRSKLGSVEALIADEGGVL